MRLRRVKNAKPQSQDVPTDRGLFDVSIMNAKFIGHTIIPVDPQELRAKTNEELTAIFVALDNTDNCAARVLNEAIRRGMLIPQGTYGVRESIVCTRSGLLDFNHSTIKSLPGLPVGASMLVLGYQQNKAVDRVPNEKIFPPRARYYWLRTPAV